MHTVFLLILYIFLWINSNCYWSLPYSYPKDYVDSKYCEYTLISLNCTLKNGKQNIVKK